MRDQKIVAVNGCFDILHVGHIKLIQHAADYGEVYVFVNSDDSIEDLKGHRPYIGEEDRADILRAISGVKAVMIFKDQTDLHNLYAWLCPDVMVIGDEYKDKTIIGREFARTVVFFKKLPGLSSSYIVERIRNESS